MEICNIKTTYDLKIYLMNIFGIDEDDILGVEQVEILIKEGSESILMKLEDDDSIIEEYLNNVPINYSEIHEVMEYVKN